MNSHLKKEIRWVVHEHHQRTHANVVGTIRETKQENGGKVMHDLFFEILIQNMIHVSAQQNNNVNTHYCGRYTCGETLWDFLLNPKQKRAISNFLLN